MLNLSLIELKLLAKSRSIKGYENKSEDDLIKILGELKTIINLSINKIRDIKENFNELRHAFPKLKINEIRRSLYNIRNPENLSILKIKEIAKNLNELEESLSKLKKYYDNDDIEYKAIREVGNLFNQSTDEDYYKPIKTTSVFDNKNNISNIKIKEIKTKFYQFQNIFI